MLFVPLVLLQILHLLILLRKFFDADWTILRIVGNTNRMRNALITPPAQETNF